MILKDFQCQKCNHIAEKYVNINISNLHDFCVNCMQNTNHESLCGGIALRIAVHNRNLRDFVAKNGGKEISKHITLGRPEAVDADNHAIKGRFGKIIHDKASVQPNAAKERINKNYYRKSMNKPLFLY